MGTTPAFDDEFLESVAAAFRKRRKALSHQAACADCDKVYEVGDGAQSERMEIRIGDKTRRGSILRLHVWPDRWIWIDARCGTKSGWAWAWTDEGRLTGDASRPIIEALEKTHALMWSMEKSRTGELAAPWRRLLAKGPKLTR